MGSLYLLMCTECGYGEEIYEGVGMSAAVYEPMLCTACRRVGAVETSPPNPEGLRGSAAEQVSTEVERCPHCGGDQLRPWGFNWDAEPQSGPCPQCGGTIELQPIGMWD